MTHPGRYSTPQMDRIWSEQNAQHINHTLWLTVRAAQIRLQPTLPTHPDATTDYGTAARLLEPHPDSEDSELRLNHWVQEAVLDGQLRHQTLARLEAFEQFTANQRQDTTQGAYHELHRGLTSSDIADNTAQIQTLQAMRLTVEHLVHLIEILAAQARTHAQVKVMGRTHGLPAQVTTLGHRWAVILQPLLGLYDEAQTMIRGWALRGIKGAVGTAADQMAVLQDDIDTPWRYSGRPGSASESPTGPDMPTDGSEGRGEVAGAIDGRFRERWLVDELSMAVAERFGVVDTMIATNQLYHRSYDQRLTDWLARVSSVAQTHTQTIRHMVMLGLATEAPAEDTQVGSSAMPHKNNPRYAERVFALAAVTRGYHHMVMETAGAPWLEGDVSTSATRNIALPGAFKTVDSLMATWRHVLNQFTPDLKAIQREIADHVESLSTGLILAACIRAGANRHDAHQAIREATVEDRAHPSLQLGIWATRLADHLHIPLDYRTILRILRHVALTGTPVGTVARQIQGVCSHAEDIVKQHQPLVAWEVDLP